MKLIMGVLMDDRVKILIELRGKFSAIRDIMEKVATHESSIPDLANDYNELYSSIAEDIGTLEEIADDELKEIKEDSKKKMNVWNC